MRQVWTPILLETRNQGLFFSYYSNYLTLIEQSLMSASTISERLILPFLTTRTIVKKQFGSSLISVWAWRKEKKEIIEAIVLDGESLRVKVFVCKRLGFFERPARLIKRNFNSLWGDKEWTNSEFRSNSQIADHFVAFDFKGSKKKVEIEAIEILIGSSTKMTTVSFKLVWTSLGVGQASSALAHIWACCK